MSVNYESESRFDSDLEHIKSFIDSVDAVIDKKRIKTTMNNFIDRITLNNKDKSAEIVSIIDQFEENLKNIKQHKSSKEKEDNIINFIDIVKNKIDSCLISSDGNIEDIYLQYLSIVSLFSILNFYIAKNIERNYNRIGLENIELNYITDRFNIVIKKYKDIIQNTIFK